MQTHPGARVVAVDLGTSNCKAALYVGGRQIAQHAEPLVTSFPSPGAAEQDPEAWLMAVALGVRAVTAGLGGEVDAIGLTAESDTLVLVDQTGTSMHSALLWMDTRGTREAAELEAMLGRELIHRTTGLRSSFNFTLPKLCWVRSHEPKMLRDSRWAFQPKDFLFHALTGHALTDPSSASRTLAYDLQAATWANELLEAGEIPFALLPDLAATSIELRGLLPAAASELGLRAGTPVVLGAADRAAEVLGLGVQRATAMVSTGTSTGVATVMDGRMPPDDDRITSPCHALPDQLLGLASVPTTGAALDWLAAVTGLQGVTAGTRLLEEAANAAPGAGGVIGIPWFTGARSLYWNPDVRGGFLGLGLAATRGDLARGLVEGISFEVATILEAFDGGIARVERLALTGGVHRSDFMCQLMADVTGRPAWRYSERDGALVGAMLLATAAIEATDIARSAQERLSGITQFTPDPEAHEGYRNLALRHSAAAQAVLDLASSE